MKKLLAIILLFGFSASFAVDTATVFLQNGAEGYNGCEDSWISSQSAGSNNGSAEKLNVKYEKCVS